MSLNKILLLVAALAILSISCEEKKALISDDQEKWQNYLQKVSAHSTPGSQVNPKVYLILRSSECSPALEELKAWNQYSQSQGSVDVELIIIDKYEASAQVLLETEKIAIPYSMDHEGEAFNQDLIQISPVKILFNIEGEMLKANTISSRDKVSDFIAMD